MEKMINRLLCTTLVFALALTNSANSQTTQDVSKIMEGKMMTDIQKHVESLIAMKGNHFLNIHARGKRPIFHVSTANNNGGTIITVWIMMYPFADSLEKTFADAGIKQPSGWKVVDFTQDKLVGEVGFNATGMDSAAIAAFAEVIFTRLIKSPPTDFLVDPNGKQYPTLSSDPK